MISTVRRSRPGVLSSQQPLLYAAIAFATGILLGSRSWYPASWWIAGALILILLAAFFVARQQLVALPCGLLILTALGALDFQIRQRSVTTSDTARFADGSEVIVTGHVIRDGVLRRAGGTAAVREVLDMAVEQVERDRAISQTNFGLRLSLYHDAA